MAGKFIFKRKTWVKIQPVLVIVVIVLAITNVMTLMMISAAGKHDSDLRAWTTTAENAMRDAKGADITAVPCDPPVDLRTSDLCAQWKAADAANSSAFAAWVAFAVGVVLNLLALAGLWFTYLATKKQVKIANDALSAGSRAWLEVRCKVNGKLVLAPPDKLELARIKIKSMLNNVGNSPATHVDLNMDFRFLSRNVTDVDSILSEYCASLLAVSESKEKAVFPGRKWKRPIREFDFDFSKINALEEKGYYTNIPLLVGRVIYKSPHVDGLCETRFVYWLECYNELGEIVPLHSDPVKWLDRRLRLGLGRTSVK